MIMVPPQEAKRFNRLLQVWKRRWKFTRRQILRVRVDNEIGNLMVHE